MDDRLAHRLSFSLSALFGIVSAVAIACALSPLIGPALAFSMIGWFTALCFCRSVTTLLFVAGLPLLVWIAFGMFAIVASLVNYMFSAS